MNPAEHSARRRRRLPILLEPEQLELRTWVQIVRTFNRMERRLELALERHGLSLAQFDVLATLDAAEGISQQDLAARLLVTKGNICGLIDRMETGGLVERRSDPEDRRTNRMFLTRAGRALLVKSAPEQMTLLKKFMGALSAPELQRLFQYFDRIEEATED
jgi:MarR family transcriptional regulator, organic hydroperoxide resistance regulator